MNGLPTPPEHARAWIEVRGQIAWTALWCLEAPVLDPVEGSSVRLLKRLVAAIGGGVALGLLIAAPAFAGSISSPTSPFTLPVDASGNPVSFTISGTGFTAGVGIFVEECDGVPSSTPNYNPTLHCDNATSPSAVQADSTGAVNFPANDPNFGFTPFPAGLSPQNLFNCIAPGQTPPSNGKPTFTNCQLRMSSNNGAATSDQAFITLTYPPPSTGVAEVPYAVILPIGFLLIGGAFWFLYRRRHAAASAA